MDRPMPVLLGDNGLLLSVVIASERGHTNQLPGDSDNPLFNVNIEHWVLDLRGEANGWIKRMRFAATGLRCVALMQHPLTTRSV